MTDYDHLVQHRLVNEIVDHSKFLVLGFAFTDDFREVVLIEKSRPTWQKGKLNGVGGKTEPTDANSLAAICREFQEETGVETSPFWWTHYATLFSKGLSISVFFLRSTQVVDAITSITDEVVSRYHVEDVCNGCYKTIGNIPWFLMMAKFWDLESSKVLEIVECGTKLDIPKVL